MQEACDRLLQGISTKNTTPSEDLEYLMGAAAAQDTAKEANAGDPGDETRSVNGRSINLIDTPGFFDANRSEEDMKPEILSCITECAPGPHAFLIVLKVEKFSEQEQDVIRKILQYFSEDALKYAVIVFTHGDQLPKGKTIQEFVSQNKNLSDLNKQQKNYRSNQSQVEDLLNTIDKLVMENNGGYYTNKMLQTVEEEINIEASKIKLSSGHLSQEEVRQQAKTIVHQQAVIKLHIKYDLCFTASNTDNVYFYKILFLILPF
uniref:Uncharacterized LOC111239971 n=1 Tax=Seriola dumerili TaxID=41447 RepID=A0A3B4T6U6_SERDU